MHFFDVMPMWEKLSLGEESLDTINIIVETPKNSRNLYKYDRKDKVFKLDSVLPSSNVCPTDYGIIPQTLYDDGEPLCAFVLGEKTFTGCIIKAKPIGMLKMLISGAYTDRLLAVPVNDSRYTAIDELEDVPQYVLVEIASFVKSTMRNVEIIGWKGADMAKRCIEHSFNLYKRKKGV